MSDLAGLSDADLVRRMAVGDEDAFVALYRRRQGAVYRFAWQMSGSSAVAEEVTQEVFLVLIESAGRYDASRGPVLSWLFGVARNRVLRWLEKDGRYRPNAEEMEETEGAPASAGGAVLVELERNETLEMVRQAVLSLPPHYREAVVLCDLQEAGYEEAARILGCAVGTVRSRLARGRALLAGKLRHARCST